MISIDRLCLLAALFLSFDSLAESKLILWDVGQGQWATWSDSDSCHHFDMGGEKFPFRVLSECRKKVNRLSITHWDFDHISFVFKALKYGLSFCVFSLPEEDHKWKARLERQSSCQEIIATKIESVLPHLVSQKRNDRSVIFKINNNVLITGDAPAKAENLLHRYISISNVKYLIAGHHGSLTSSSEEFIGRLSDLRMALLSARKQKYNHPHPIVQARFKRNRVPLVSTHDWGHLIITLTTD